MSLQLIFVLKWTIMQFPSDLVKAHDSVAVITFNKTRNTLVVVKQFRPAVYYGQIFEYLEAAGSAANSDDLVKKFPPKDAITMELCAGICDKDLPLNEIAREELIEECGYDVSVDRLEEVMRYRSGVGTTGSLQVMFYCEVTDDDKVRAIIYSCERHEMQVYCFEGERSWRRR